MINLFPLITFFHCDIIKDNATTKNVAYPKKVTAKNGTAQLSRLKIFAILS